MHCLLTFFESPSPKPKRYTLLCNCTFLLLSSAAICVLRLRSAHRFDYAQHTASTTISTPRLGYVRPVVYVALLNLN